MIAFLTSCNNEKADQKKAQEEIMKDHDELMAQMDKIMTNKSMLMKLENHLDSLKMKDAALDTAKLKLEIEALKADLASSNDAMMTWMHRFNPDFTGKKHQEVMDYLKDQKIKVDSVKTIFNESISKSDALISKYN
ncbi:MAG: hypothetical protein IE931_14265 [Sphingobacteriales bacterium]|nr:hypothetical protein [Sphingobacteriales bacterium]